MQQITTCKINFQLTADKRTNKYSFNGILWMS